MKDNTVVVELGITSDPNMSGFNPIYQFFDGDAQKIGEGYGQSMDLRIASALIGEHVGGSTDGVTQSVIDWIKSHAN